MPCVKTFKRENITPSYYFFPKQHSPLWYANKRTDNVCQYFDDQTTKANTFIQTAEKESTAATTRSQQMSLANANEDKLYWPIQKRAISDSPFAVGSSQNQTPPTASHCRYLLTLCGSYATTEIVTPKAFANCSHHKSNAIWSAWVGFTELCVYYFQMTINCESFTQPWRFAVAVRCPKRVQSDNA